MKPSASALADAGSAYLGRPYAETDCQAFVERCLKDIGIRLNLPGSNAWYRRMTWTGTPEECRARFGRVPAGAFLFILKDDGGEPAKYRADGIGNASHIGIRTADGAIHSSASRGCVAKSAVAEKTVRGGWNRVGLWDALDYGPDIDLSAKSLSNRKEGSPAMEIQSVTVSSPNGKPVKLRQAASPSSKAYARWVEIPSGTVGVLLEKGESWSRCQFGRQAGYMQSQYLTLGGFAGNTDFSPAPSEPVTLPLTLTANEARMLLPLMEAIRKELTARGYAS